MSSTQIVTNQLDSHKEDLPCAIKAVGCSRAGAVLNMGDVNGDSEGIIEGLVLQSHHPANENNTGTQLLSSSPAMSVLTIITSSKPTGKKFNFLKGKQPAGRWLWSPPHHLLPTNTNPLLPEQPKSPRLPFPMACKAPWTGSLTSSKNLLYGLSTYKQVHEMKFWILCKLARMVSAFPSKNSWSFFLWRTLLLHKLIISL